MSENELLKEIYEIAKSTLLRPALMTWADWHRNLELGVRHICQVIEAQAKDTIQEERKEIITTSRHLRTCIQIFHRDIGCKEGQYYDWEREKIPTLRELLFSAIGRIYVNRILALLMNPEEAQKELVRIRSTQGGTQ